MLHAGVDMHKHYSVITVVDDEGKALVRGAKLPNEEEHLIAFFKGLEEAKEDGVRVVLEAGPSWMWACDLLDDYAIENVLCHPLKTKAIASARIKTDKLDSEILAQLLRTDFIPCAFKPDKETRDLRELLRYRAILARRRAQVKNSVHALLSKRNIHLPVANPFGKEGLALLSALRLPQPARTILDGHLAVLSFLSERIAEADGIIRAKYRESEGARLLSTIPGVAEFLSLLILSEIGDPERFHSAKHLSSFAGLVPSVHRSGVTERHGRITRQGSRWLRWALVEAAIHAARKPGPLREHYLKVRKRKGAKVARVAAARKLCTYIYHMLKEKKTYEALVGPVSFYGHLG